MIKNINSALQRLGLTRSNKVICQPFEIDQESFAEITREYSKADHFDGYSLFQFLIGRELRRHGRAAANVIRYDTLARYHRYQLIADEFAQELLSLSLTTIFDIAKHGRSCSDHIFHD